MLIVFVLGFQSVDFFGDIILSYKLLNNNEENSKNYWLLKMTGILMVIPVVFSTLLMIPHWLKDEVNEERWWKKVLTFILIPVYPQYRALRVLFFWCCCSGEKAAEEKKRLDDTVSFFEPFVESIPQTHVMMILFLLINPEKIAKLTGESGTSNIPIISDLGFGGLDTSTIVTIKFIITILTSAFGIAQFLSKSPLRAISKDGFCMGYLKCSFFTLFFGSLLWLAGRAFWLAAAIVFVVDNDDKGKIPYVVTTWISANFIVQVLLVVIVIGYRLGLMKTFKLMVHWPAVILTSMFTPFMYHAIDHNGEQVILLSRKWTIINSLFSTVVSSGGTFVIFHFIIEINWNQVLKQGEWLGFLIYFIIPLILILITLFLILGLFFCHKCCCCCFPCCSLKLRRSGICENNYDKTVDIDEEIRPGSIHEKNELIPIQNSLGKV